MEGEDKKIPPEQKDDDRHREQLSPEKMGKYTESLPEGFGDPDNEGVRTNGKEIAIELQDGRYFIADPKQHQFFVGFASQGGNGLEVTWNGNTTGRMPSWEDTQEMTEKIGYSYIGYNHFRSDTQIFFVRPWVLDTKKDPAVRSFVYCNVSEKEILKRYNVVVQLGTLQAHLFDPIEHPGVVKIDLLRTKDGVESRKEEGYGLKDPSVNVAGRNPGLSREQGSFMSQVKTILRALHEMGYKEIIAEPSDSRRAKVYIAAGMHPMSENPNILRGSIEEILDKKRAIS